jgi:hypothetical protein
MAPGNIHHHAAPLLLLSFWACSTPSGSPAKVADGHAPAAQDRACSAAAEVKPAPSFGQVGNPIVVASDFDFPLAQEIEPCVWSGTFAASVVLYADGEARVPLLETQFVRVKSIELPPHAGKPAKLNISWPVHMVAWAPATSFPFALREHLDIVKGTYWLAPGARLQAWVGEKHGSALVSRPYSRNLSHPAFAKRALLEQTPCSKLTLPKEGLFVPTATGTHALFVPGVEHWLNLAPGTELHSQPGKAAQGRVTAHSVARLEQQGNWIHVRSYDSYGLPGDGGVDFSGWVPDSSTTRGLRVALAFGPLWLEPTHKAPRRLPVRRNPDAAAPVVGKTAKGVPFRAVTSERGFVAIQLPGLAGAGLWIAEADLCDSERLP